MFQAIVYFLTEEHSSYPRTRTCYLTGLIILTAAALALGSIVNPAAANSAAANSTTAQTTSPTTLPPLESEHSQSDPTLPVNSDNQVNRQVTITVANESSVNSYTDGFISSINSTGVNSPSPQQRQIATLNPFLWVFDIALDLHTDYDQDGHYSNFSLSIDLDTSLTATTVYAVLYLASEGGPWNEYAVTGNFTVSGRGSADTFSLLAELDTGYPSGYYDHYVEIYDANTHELIGSYGPADSHLFVGLPIESSFLDNSVSFGTDISLTFTGTGAMDSGPLCLLAFYFFARRRRRV